MAEQTRKERNREKQQFWATHIDSWKISGLRQVDYIRQNDLSRHRFTYWKRKLDKKVDSVTFVPIPGKTIRPQAYHNNQGCLKLNIGGTYQIEIGDGFSPDTLSTLIRTLDKI